MGKRLVAGVLLALCLAALAAGCGSSGSDSSSSGSTTAEETGGSTESATTSSGSEGGDNPQVSIGMFAGTGAAPLFGGVESGAFEKAGLDVEATPALNGAALAAELAAGKLDMSGSNLATVVQAIAQGVPLQVIATYESLAPPDHEGAALVTMKDSGIKDGGDLGGKTVASAVLRTTADLGIRKAVQDAGGDPESVHVVSIPPPEMLQALESGHVDAAFLPEPFVTLAKANPKIAIEESPINSIGDHVISGVVVAKPDWVAENEETVTKFVEVLDEQVEMAQKDPDSARKIIPNYSEIPPELAEKAELAESTPIIDTESIETQTKLMGEYGWLPKEPTLEDVVWQAAPGLK